LGRSTRCPLATESHHRVILVGTKHDTDRLRFVFSTLKAIAEVHVHLHLPLILVHELTELEIHQKETPQHPIVKNQVDVEMVAFQGHLQ
jgi:hypothetical protein